MLCFHKGIVKSSLESIFLQIDISLKSREKTSLVSTRTATFAGDGITKFTHCFNQKTVIPVVEAEKTGSYT